MSVKQIKLKLQGPSLAPVSFKVKKEPPSIHPSIHVCAGGEGAGVEIDRLWTHCYPLVATDKMPPPRHPQPPHPTPQPPPEEDGLACTGELSRAH